MNKKCPKCNLANFISAEHCIRCESELVEIRSTLKQGGTVRAKSGGFFNRAVICVLVCAAAIFGFYGSLIMSSTSLDADQMEQVNGAIHVLDEAGFANEVFYLKNLTAFRGDDNWLNSSVAKENAFAATNYPFEIMTVYPDFFTYPKDDIERAAILLHEAKHLQGKDEKGAYEFVWKNKKRLGWIREKYKKSTVWKEIRKQTKEYVPNLFVCDFNEYDDCAE